MVKYYNGEMYRIPQAFEDEVRADERANTIEEAIHELENSTVNCHEDYVDGIYFAMGVLEQLKETEE